MIFNARGRLVATLNSAIKFFNNDSGAFISEYGIYADGGYLIWTGFTDSGENASSGVYIFIIETHSGVKKTGKIVLIK